MNKDQLAAMYAAMREKLGLPPDTEARHKEREKLGLPPDTDWLKALSELAETASVQRDRAGFIRAIWQVLDEYPVAKQEIDGNPLRGQSDRLRQLADRLAETHRLMLTVQDATGITMDAERITDDERYVRDLQHQSESVADRPTEDAKVYAITQLLDIAKAHGARPPSQVVIAALALVGEECSENKVGKVRRRHTRERHQANCLACRQAKARDGAFPARCPANPSIPLGSLLDEPDEPEFD